ncbi:MAG: hypothetical protein ACOYZ8_09890 [Chloroflexota bacterium]
MDSILAIGVGGFLALFVLFLLPAIYLHAAARMSKVRKPFGSAILATILQLLVQGILSAIVAGVSAALMPMVALLLAIPLALLSVLADLWIIQAVYSVEFGKSCSIWLTMVLEIMLTGVVIVAVSVFSTEAAHGNLPEIRLPSFNFDIPLSFNLWSGPGLATTASILLAGALWFKTVKSTQNQIFWILFSLGWTMICVSYAQTRAAGIQLVEFPTSAHVLYTLGYVLIGVSFWVVPASGDSRQAWILSGVFILAILVTWFAVTPALSVTIYGGGRSGPWEEVQPLRNRGLATVSLALLTALGVEVWLRLGKFDSFWKSVLVWPTIGVTLAGAAAWLTVAVWKPGPYDWRMTGWVGASFFLQAALMGVGLYQAFRAEKETPATQAIENT